MPFYYFLIGLLVAGCNLFADEEPGAVGARAPRCIQPQTRIMNPGFELGQAHWKVIAAEMIGAKVSSDSLSVYEGSRALKVDLEKAKRFSRSSFLLASPWVTLSDGGNFSFSLWIKSNRPGAKAALRIFNNISRDGMRSGRLQPKPLIKEFRCDQNWSQIIFTGALPAAEKNNYRFAVQLSDPAIYWLDQVEILQNDRLITLTPEIEAVLQPLPAATTFYPATGRAEALLWVVNHSTHARQLQWSARQRARLNAFEQPVTAQIDLAPRQIYLTRLQFEMPYADIYEVRWELRDQNSKLIQSDKMPLAAMNQQLPRADGGNPVWGLHLNAVNWEATLPILRNAGVRFLRNVALLHWDLVEPKPGAWQWPDSLVQFLRTQGFSILGKLCFTPKWAIDPAKLNDWLTQNKMPQSLEAYRNYIRSVVSHYRHDIDCWEIWNEPNLPRYFDGTPQDYATLLTAATEELKAVQPDAQVAGYSVTLIYKPETRNFVQAVINAQPNLRLDAFAFHPYSLASPEETGISEKIDDYRTLITEHQGSTPQLWSTEFGYPGKDTVNDAIAYNPPAPPRTIGELSQAAYLVRATGLLKMAGVKYFFAYALDSERIDRGPDVYGMLEENWIAAPKPALLAYLTLVALLGDAKFERRLDLGDPETFLLQFRRYDGKNIGMLWTTKREKNVNLPKALLRSERYDLFGNRINNNSATVTVTPIPGYFMF
ncbi:MAG: hypothetical protein ONB44_05055 [candidate division KSB1 bacterium]|nr:hypothetical protein [candidate division KSB1 bacterium]MDZ7301492.1 hypothetical protein [candidate division KSB1 bacterium]MDZ7310894.1 hypothetical protein [candidate division KSB1 bacterium]